MKRLLIALPLLLAACTTQQTNPQATVYQIVSSYDLALEVAIAYDSLPACGTVGATKVCSDAAVTRKIKQAKDTASVAVHAAENAVRDPSFSQSQVQALIVSAQQAVVALTAILNQYEVK